VTTVAEQKIPPEVHQLIDYVRDFSYDAGYAAGYNAAEADYAGSLREAWDPDAPTLAAARETLIRRLDAKAYREEAARRTPAPWVPVDWPDALVRLPGESAEHYGWRCRRREVGAA
jgi:hypothetical protein